jgi:hypothetical protein
MQAPDGSISPDGGVDAGDDGGVDAGYDAGVLPGTPWGDAGCVLPSDFPWDAGDPSLPDYVCQCVEYPGALHCPEEGGPRCDSWKCFAEDDADGGYLRQPDGGLTCFC